MKDLQQEERLIELLIEREIADLTMEKEKEVEELLKLFPEWNYDETIALTMAAINLTSVSVENNLPKNLSNKILSDAERFFDNRKQAFDNSTAALVSERALTGDTGGFFGKLFGGGFSKWGGWAAAAACAILALGLYLTRTPKNEVVVNPPTQNTPKIEPGLAEQRAQFLATTQDKIQTNLTDFNPKQPRGVTGDVVWSNSQQKGFIRIHGLPVNDKTKETYQLWVFDAAQNAKTPIDGGIFDVDSNGDVIVPVNAKLKVGKPTMFAVTAEKPGGVVVSDLSKVMTVAKV